MNTNTEPNIGEIRLIHADGKQWAGEYCPLWEIGPGARFLQHSKIDVNNAKSVMIKTADECNGQKRTHAHINGGDCYDMRVPVWVLRPLKK